MIVRRSDDSHMTRTVMDTEVEGESPKGKIKTTWTSPGEVSRRMG